MADRCVCLLDMSRHIKGDVVLCWIAAGTLALAILLGGCVAPVVEQFDPAMARDFIRQGEDYLGQGLTDSALAAFGMALEADPTLLEPHMNMGAIYRHHGNFELAGRCYERAIAVDPNHFDARYYYGWMQHLQGHIQKAVQSYLHALSIKPDSFDANLNLAGAYLQLGRPGDALSYITLATQLNPDSQMAWANLATVHNLLHQYEDAIGAYHHAMELGEMAEPILLGLANAHMRLGHFEQALVVLRSLNEQHPSAMVYQQMGYAQFKMRRFDDALASFRTVIAQAGQEDPVALNGAGVCLMALYLKDAGDATASSRDEALAFWRRSLRLRPNQPHIADLLSRYQGF